jgi:methylglutamate dehydrogenase subunit B
MLLIPCPHCGPRSHIEFTYGGDAIVRRPADEAPLAAWVDYVYLRDNPRGPHREYWQHTQGCRAFIVVERDTATHAIARAEPAGDAAP